MLSFTFIIITIYYNSIFFLHKNLFLPTTTMLRDPIATVFLTLDPQFSVIFILKKVSAIPKSVDHSNKKLT